MVQDFNKLIEAKMNSIDLNVGELNLKISMLMDEINSKNENIEEAQKKIVEL